MSFRLGSIAYVPPPHFPGALAFLENLKKFPPRHELLLYANPDHNYSQVQVRLNKDPEFTWGSKKSGNPIKEPRWVVNNAIFAVGLKIATLHGFSHIIYLESDCRVGQPSWDQVIFNEFFGLGFPVIAAGTLVCWNPFNAGSAVAERWNKLIQSKNTARNFPIPTYGTRDTGDPCIFPNGALGVYDMAWMNTLFDVHNIVDIATRNAWDFQLGEKIWQKFGIDSFDMVGQLGTIYSGFGDSNDPRTRGVTTLEERLAMLKNGEVVACHQVKGEIYV